MFVTRAMALLSIATVSCVVAGPALGQVRTFNLPQQDVSRAIPEFARQAGLQVVAPADGLDGLTSGAVQGELETREALKLLLQGTGLEVASDANGVIVLRRPRQLGALEGALEGDRELMRDVIIVTAQKRDETELEVPISLSGFSASEIDAYRIESLRDLSRQTPGLLVSAFNMSSPTIAIRGATNTFTQIGANKPVSVVLDDVFIPRNSAATFELFGLESIQVLKGPQGTLFGRNVTGGAIVIDTGRPQIGGEIGGALRLGAGDFGLVQADAVLDAPVGEAAALRIAASSKERDGYGRDRLTGLEQDDLDSKSARLQFRLVPTEDLEFLFGVDYADDQNGGRTLSSRTLGNDGDRRTSELGFVQGFDRNMWGASARLYWDLPAGKLSSISAFRESQSGEDFSGVGASFTFLTGTGFQTVNRDVDNVESLSQEFRYASPQWSWGDFVAGVFLYTEDAGRLLRVRNLAARTGVVTSDILTDQAVNSDSFGVFLDGVLHLPAHFDLRLGARYSEDTKTASLVRTDLIRPTGPGSFTLTDLEETWSDVTPRAVLTWSPTPNLNLFASYTEGYTSGGFNTEAATPAALSTPFAPETVTNREIGLKSFWLNGKLGANISLFQMDYEDKQELFFNGVTRVLNIVNAAEASMEGAELEVNYRPADWLGLSATYGALDTMYDRFVIPGGATNTGNRLGSSPEEKWSLAADWRAPLGDAGYIIGSAAYAFTGNYFTGAARDPNLYIRSYHLANATLGYESAGGGWRILAWTKNLTDEDYLLTPSTQGVLAEYLGEPQTWGVSLEARF